MSELQLLVDGVVVKSFPLDSVAVTIGRAQGNDIVINDDAVSGEHARIDLVPDDYMDDLFNVYIEDLGSTNGTYVNDEAVQRRQLRNLDSVRLAWTNFKFVASKDMEITKTSVIVQ
jgi:pSer/pThr/pTyr-binding forkhead associated (FHA) protein